MKDRLKARPSAQDSSSSLVVKILNEKEKIYTGMYASRYRRLGSKPGFCAVGLANSGQSIRHQRDSAEEIAHADTGELRAMEDQKRDIPPEEENGKPDEGRMGQLGRRT